MLFIPGEAFLAPALERDPDLLEHAMARKVHIATPTTLVTMLRTAQYAWQQAALSENARAVFDLGRELYDRLAGMGRHVDRLGKALSNAVTTYNQAVGSLESRVLVSARRFSQLGLVDADAGDTRSGRGDGAGTVRAGAHRRGRGRCGPRHRPRAAGHAGAEPGPGHG